MAGTESGRRYPSSLVVVLVALAALSLVNLVVSLGNAGVFERSNPAVAVPAPTAGAQIAFITGGVDPFWDMTVVGARDAAARYNAKLAVHMPDTGVDSQNQILRAALTAGGDGVAISPLDATGQVDLLNQVAAAMNLITFDSDAPRSNRLCYVGTNNYLAGWQCGEVVQRCLPDGGRVLISIGSLDKDNGRKRRQGLIDRLLDRGYAPERANDTVDTDLAGTRFTIVATLVDDNNAAQAKANVLKALAEYDEVVGLIGLFGYSGPSILAALTEAGRLDQLKVIAFDDHEATLDGIRAGHIDATIVQDAYLFGYSAVEALATRAQDLPNLPLAGEILYPCFPVTKDNVDAYAARCAAQLKREKP